MKHNYLLIILVCILFNSCKKEEVPALVTSPLTGISLTSAIGGGNILSEGTEAIIDKGICWSTDPFPTIEDAHTSNGAGADSYTSFIYGLSEGTTYYVRAYAINSVGTGYGEELKFTTLKQTTVVTTTPAKNILTISAILTGTITTDDFSTKVSFEYFPFEYLYSNSNHISVAGNNTINLNTNTYISKTVFGLKPGTNYGFRIKAENAIGTLYGEVMSFITLGNVPNVTTLAATNISSRGVTFNGTVDANLLRTTVKFEFGLTTSYGINAEASQSPVNADYSGNVNATIQGLTPGKTYHFRILAVNNAGTSYGNDTLFSTLSAR